MAAYALAMAPHAFKPPGHTPSLRQAAATLAAAAVLLTPALARPEPSPYLVWGGAPLSEALRPTDVIDWPFESYYDGICELGRWDRSTVNSVRCLSCHDGSVASSAEYSSGALDPLGSGGSPAWKLSGDAHPVEIDYGEAQLRRPGTLRPLAQLPDSLVLNEGRVTCATCHAGTSEEKGRVAVTMSGSTLCLACHSY